MKRKGNESRKHPRHRLACPVTLFGPREEIPVTSGSGNLSDGGLYVTVPASEAPSVSAKVSLSFCVARKGGLPDIFAAKARVLRHDLLDDEHLRGVALQFHQPLALNLA